LISCRRGQTGGRPSPDGRGSTGTSAAHCTSVRSPRPTPRSSQWPVPPRSTF